MKVLLTGASGFIGGHLLTRLIKELGNDSAVALTSKTIPNVNCIIYKSIENFELPKSKFDEFTHVVHAGAFIPKDMQQANDINRCFGNIEYTKELFSYDFVSLKKVINLSTIDVYGITTEVLSESSNLNPVSLYGSSKLYCEAMIKAFAEQRGVDYLNFRIGHVYGPGEEKYKKVLPIAIKNILENKPLELWGDGSDLRSFIFINDVVKSIYNSLHAEAKNIDINLVSGAPITIKELLLKLVEISSKKVIINQLESNHQKRNLVFNNSLLLKTVLEKETDLLDGLKIEYEYMKYKYEHNI